MSNKFSVSQFIDLALSLKFLKVSAVPNAQNSNWLAWQQSQIVIEAYLPEREFLHQAKATQRQLLLYTRPLLIMYLFLSNPIEYNFQMNLIYK
jgi:hypothetical protein